jgi:hypothetical protein
VDHEQFQDRLRVAQGNYEAESEPLYWCGYARGLRRAYLGRRFSTDTDHLAWLEFKEDQDPCGAELGRGYRDGLTAVICARGHQPGNEGPDHWRKRPT